ncbi:MAG: hypothetical protein M3Y87_28990 [Myxococcota bacterium]|nr:hypothetical protein [Myxococcota bacterium]
MTKNGRLQARGALLAASLVMLACGEDPATELDGGARRDAADVPRDAAEAPRDAVTAPVDARVTGSDATIPPGDDDASTPPTDAGTPPVGPRVYEEIGGLVAVESEHFAENDDNGRPRDWVLFSATEMPSIEPDPDPPHLDGASGGAYLEGLPDTRVTHDDPLVSGESFYNTAGTGPTLSYRIRFRTAGTYYVWARALTTGGEDNGIHIGLDDAWPSTGTRLQLCGSRGMWQWSSAQRDSGGSACGIDGTITIEVPTPGEHVVRVSMREDGFELDKLVLTTDRDYEPTGEGPPERPYAP